MDFIEEDESRQAREMRRATPEEAALARASSRMPPHPPVRGDDVIDALVLELWGETINLDTEVHWLLEERSRDTPIAYKYNRREEGEMVKYTICLNDEVPAGYIWIAPDKLSRLGWRWIQQPVVTEDPASGSIFNNLCWWIQTCIKNRFGNSIQWDELEQIAAELREQAEPQADSGAVGEPQIVITDSIPLDMGIEEFKNWLTEYQIVQHPSSEPSVHYTPPAGNRVCFHYRVSDCWIDFEATVVAPGKLTITKMTCSPHFWKDYFERLIGAIPPAIREDLSCFISYSSKDKTFAERLHKDLQDAGVQCWFAPEDMRIGDRIRPTIDQAVRSYDKLLLVLSKHSIDSDWVEKEVETASEEERKRKKTMLFPVRLDSAVMETDQVWAADIRRTRHIGDFTRWKDHDAYQKAFERLLRDLKAEEEAEAAT